MNIVLACNKPSGFLTKCSFIKHSTIITSVLVNLEVKWKKDEKVVPNFSWMGLLASSFVVVISRSSLRCFVVGALVMEKLLKDVDVKQLLCALPPQIPFSWRFACNIQLLLPWESFSFFTVTKLLPPSNPTPPPKKKQTFTFHTFCYLELFIKSSLRR